MVVQSECALVTVNSNTLCEVFLKPSVNLFYSITHWSTVCAHCTSNKNQHAL